MPAVKSIVRRIVMRKMLTLAVAAFCIASFSHESRASGDDDVPQARCTLPQGTVALVEKQLRTVVNLPDGNGGIFKPNRMWAAIVDRQGHLCSVIVTGDAWPGSRAIAIAKAYTANGFSNDALALSTANLYAATQPGGSLYGLNNSNPFDARFLEQGSGIGHTLGGVITFGGGVALYAGGKVIGGLGVSGDSACADHAIAYRMRKLAGLGSVPAGQGPNNTDNIVYSTSGSPMGFEHPHCFPSDLSAAKIEQIPSH
ncbi:GlcG/HbpS family heme-binding protein [Paraburkholderia youngii]|uniref:GlcG/HbpS family heme-binding protein n=1 Tax=Paraburkholderia youngii TaxID=2782701 RepID=UPI002815E3FF|nr:heme-binding protein [Paraburkholderia youngii]